MKVRSLINLLEILVKEGELSDNDDVVIIDKDRRKIAKMHHFMSPVMVSMLYNSKSENYIYEEMHDSLNIGVKKAIG